MNSVGIGGTDVGSGSIKDTVGNSGIGTDTGAGAIENNTSGTGKNSGTGKDAGTGKILNTKSQILTGTTNYTYDNNGNLIDDGNQKYFYDYKNRLIKVTNQEGDNIAAFSYDTLNRRYKKETSVKSIRYIFDGVNIDRELISDKITETQKEKTYINGIGVDNLLAYEIGGNIYYFAKDHLGNIDGLTDSAGSSVINYQYSSFGKVFVLNPDTTLTNLEDYTGATYENQRGYTGREYDTEIDLLYLRARYYSPELGRFISRDPIDIDDDINLYTYVGNNPLIYVDLEGMEKSLQKVVDYLNYYGLYLENRPVFVKEFSSIILDPQKTNFKHNPYLLDRAEWIDKDCTDLSKNCGKKITMNGKDIWLADLGNIGFGYLAQKQGYSLGTIYVGAFAVTLTGREDGGKKDGVFKNESEDRPYYKSGYELSLNTKVGKLTKEDLLKNFLQVLPNGR